MRRLVTWLIALALLAAPAAARGQSYFGQNKVQYRSFDWQIIRTEHFDVYFYGDMRPAALDAARMAERGYARLSRILQHEFIERKPIILYASQSDFVQTNTTPEDIGEGTGGFTDFYRHRMVLPLTGAYADFEHVLQHEMVHAFQYDIFARGRAGAGFQTISQVNPPLWFMEGMAEYLSLGPVDPQTAMWMRDAALHGDMPTIEQLSYDPRFFPYRFGHALWAYVGQKWGDEAIGAILQGTLAGGVERAFQRTLGINLEQLGDEWIEACQNTYLPQVPEQERPRAIARAVLTEKRTGGRYNVAPQISPDGRQIIFLSERNFIFVNLYISDAEAGRNISKLLGSSLNSNFETLRFINSAGSWSQDGREFVIAAKSGGEDVLNLLDVRRRHVVGRLRLGFAGITNPSFSPDGQKIVFTGYRGGWTDLYVVDRDGRNLRRLTDDPYADLMPQWSPDGRAIAFATDRGPDTDFSILKFGNMKIALYWLDGDSIQVLPHMDEGKNINPQWAPDGSSIAFISDRNGISNVFLYDLGGRDLYQLTRMYTGVHGITDLSPAISWARQSDRLAITVYEDGAYNIYVADNPRSLKRQPFTPDPVGAIALANASAQPLRDQPTLAFLMHLRPPTGAALSTVPSAAAPGAVAPGARPAAGAPTVPVANPAGPAATGPGAPVTTPAPSSGASIYRTGGAFRPSDSQPAAAAPSATGAAAGALPSALPGVAPLSVAQLLDSAQLALPDTAEFSMLRYRPRFAATVATRPTIGYARDNFGRGFFGGAAVQLTDLLGDHIVSLAGAVNGRIEEAQFFGAYANMAHRLNWAAGISQEVYYYVGGAAYYATAGADVYLQQLNRWIVRQAFGQASYPMSRFTRWEFHGALVNLNQATLNRITAYDPVTGQPFAGYDSISTSASRSYVFPGIALVHDNTVFGWTSTLLGQRYRFDVSQAVGGLSFTQVIADYRRYDMLAFPFTFATRFTMEGRFGRDDDLFPMYLGMPDEVRGYTYTSLLDRECSSAQASQTGTCPELNQLIGSRIAVASAEFRFPLVRQAVLGFLPVGFPPIEGALFFDMGIAWQRGSTFAWNPSSTDANVRAPIRSWGASARVNLLGFAILSIDYAIPLDRPQHKHGYWIVSLYQPF